MTFGEKLSRARKNKNLSQEQLAEIMVAMEQGKYKYVLKYNVIVNNKFLIVDCDF